MMPKLKIAMVCDFFYPRIGGIEVHVLQLAQKLTQQGHEVHVLTTTAGTKNLEGIKVIRIPGSRLPGSQIIWNSRPIKLLEQILLKEKYDLVHNHNTIAWPFAYSGVYLSRKHKIPSVFTAHSLYSLGSRSVFKLLNYFVNFGDWATVFTGVSGEATRRVEMLFKGQKGFILPNGINPENWEAEAKKPSRPQIITVMRMQRKKRPQDILWALPKINKKLPENLRPTVTFVGDGNLKKPLMKRVQKLNLSSQVNFLGWQTPQQIKTLLAQSHIFIQPSRWESFSLTSLEACAAGIPVIARSQGGTKDIITHQKEGFLVKNKSELVPTVLGLINNPESIKTIGENAKKKAGNFHWDRVVKRHMEIYHLAMERNESCH